MALRNRNFSQNVPYLFIIMLGIVLLASAVSCQANKPQEISEVEETVILTEIVDDAVETEEVEEVALVDQPEVNVDECLACHTDKQTLIDTAEQVVDLESESSGEG